MSVCHLQTWPCMDMVICGVSQLKCRLRTTVTIHCESLCLVVYKMRVVAVETDRAASSGGLRPNTPPPARALTSATRPSDPGGRSTGTEGGKWALLLVCDLCGEVRQTSSLVVSLPPRISETHVSFCQLWFSKGSVSSLYWGRRTVTDAIFKSREFCCWFVSQPAF